jgi:HEAT repeat protein
MKRFLAVCIAGTLLLAANSGRAISKEEKYWKDRSFEILKKGIESKEPSIRVQTVTASSMIGSSKEVLQQLDALVEDKDAAVRVSAINALADMKARSSIPTLRKALEEDQVPEVAFAAGKALHAMNDSEGTEALYEIFDHRMSGKSNAVRREAREFFSKFHTMKSSMFMVVTEGIGFVPVPGAGAGMTAMTMLLNDPELSARAAVVLLLGRVRTQESDEMLKRAIEDKDWSVRAASAQIIAQTARLDLQDALLPLLDDQKGKVRFRAAGAYLHLSVLRDDKRR